MENSHKNSLEKQTLKAFLKQGHTILYRYGYDGTNYTLEYISPTVEDMLKRPVEDFFNKTYLLRDLIHPQDQMFVQAALKRMESYPEQVLEYRLLIGEKDYIKVIDDVMLVDQENSSTYCLFGRITNITDLRRNERAAFDNTLKYLTIFENVMEGIVTINSQGRIIDANPAAERIFGYEYSELEGKNVSILMPVSHAQNHNDYITSYLNTFDAKIIGKGRIVQGIRKSGEVFDMDLSVSAMILEDGDYFVGCIRDISEQRKAEVALSLSQDRLKTSQDFGGIGTWDWNLISNELYWSEKTFELLGYDASRCEVQPQYVTERIHPDDQHHRKVSMKNCLENGVDYDVDYRVVTKDGFIRWLNEKGNVIRDEGSKPVRMLGILQDVTEQREYEKSLEKLKDEAVQASRAKSEFLSHMSHELRTPLNAILGFAQLLSISRNSPLNERQSSQVTQIVEAGSHLLQLINDVLDLSSIEARELEFNLQDISLQNVIDESFSLMAPLALEKKVKLLAPENVDIQMETDPLRLKQVIINLLSNAIKYNREGGEVTMQVSDQEYADGKVIFRITDTGWGIAQDKLDEIFLPFNRLEHQGSPVMGSGIGLPLIKKIIEAMNGQLGVESEEEKGSMFWFVLDKNESDNMLT